MLAFSYMYPNTFVFSIMTHMGDSNLKTTSQLCQNGCLKGL